MGRSSSDISRMDIRAPRNPLSTLFRVSAIAEALNSRRFVRLLPWLSGAVLVAGIVVFLTVYFGRTSVPPVNKAAGPPVRTTDQRTVPLDPKINKLANQFIRVAVGGTDPVQAYMIS